MRSLDMKLILLLVIYGLSCHVQSAAVQPSTVRPALRRRTATPRPRTRTTKCSGRYIHICSAKRSDIGDVTQATNIEAGEEKAGTQEARGGERRGDGGRESGEYRGAREGDDLRSESSDRKQLSEERELDDIGKRHHSALDSELGRLRSLLRKTVSDVDDREEEKKEELGGEPERSIIIDTNRSYVVNDTWRMVEKILAAIESELILQPPNSDSESGKRSYEEEADDN